MSEENGEQKLSIDPLGPIRPKGKGGRPQKYVRPKNPDKISSGQTLVAHVKLARIRKTQQYQETVVGAYLESGLSPDGTFGKERGLWSDIPRSLPAAAHMPKIRKGCSVSVVKGFDPHAMDHLLSKKDMSVGKEDVCRFRAAKRNAAKIPDPLGAAVKRARRG